MFNGFVVPGSGRIKKFVVSNTGLKFNTPKVKSIVDYIINDLGVNSTLPIFTLVLIRKNGEIVDVGILYIFFTYNVEDGLTIDYSFKFNPNFEEEKISIVEAKDIINIRSEFNSIKLDNHRIFVQTKGYNLKNVDKEYFTYLATVLIELDPL